MPQPKALSTEDLLLSALKDVCEATGKGEGQAITAQTSPFADLEGFDSLTAVNVLTEVESKLQKAHPKLNLIKLGVLFATDNDTKLINVKQAAGRIDQLIANKGKKP